MKFQTMGAVLALSVMLAGCQTTGAGTQTAILGAGAASTHAPIAASQVDDGNMSCDEIRAEIGQMEQIVAEANQSQSNAQLTNAGIGIAQSLGLHLGGGSGMLTAIQAGGAAGQLTEQQRQQAQARAQQADIRRQVLSGIYQGKGC